MAKSLRNKTPGFTLIEMMFVVLLLGVVAVHIAKTQQVKNQTLTIERTAKDLNNWTQATLNYYQANNGQWPTSTNTPAPLSALTTGTNPYMPTQAECSVFTTATTGSQCGNYAEFLGVQGGTQRPSSYYVLSVQAPSLTMALMLASKLQNSWIASDNTVNTAIPAPNFATTTMATTPQPPSPSTRAAYQGWIVSAGVVSTSNVVGGDDSGGTPNNGTNVVLPNCPPGFDGHIITAPLNYLTYADGSNVWGMHLAMVTRDTSKPTTMPFGLFEPLIGTTPNSNSNTQDGSAGPGWADYIDSYNNNSVVFPTGTNDANGNPAYAVTVADRPVWKGQNKDMNGAKNDYSNQARHLVNYITFCLPLTPQKTGSASQPQYTYNTSKYPNTGYTNWYVAYAHSDFEPDAQCSNNWVSYRQQSYNPALSFNISSANCSEQLIYLNGSDHDNTGFHWYFSGSPNGYEPKK